MSPVVPSAEITPQGDAHHSASDDDVVRTPSPTRQDIGLADVAGGEPPMTEVKTVTVTPAQERFMSWASDVLVYTVVLNLFVE